LKKKPELKTQERLVYVSTVVHDICDKKYMNEKLGIAEIDHFLKKDDIGLYELKLRLRKKSYPQCPILL